MNICNRLRPFLQGKGIFLFTNVQTHHTGISEVVRQQTEVRFISHVHFSFLFDFNCFSFSIFALRFSVSTFELDK